MTVERICLEARLNSWAKMTGSLLGCVALVGTGAFFVMDALYDQHPWRPGWGLLLGTLCILCFSAAALYIVAIMVAKLIVIPRSSPDPDYGKVDRVLPTRPKKGGRSN